MSIMRCPACERFIDTDYESGEEVKGQWLCGNCASEQDAEDAGPPSAESARTSNIESTKERA